MKISFHYLATPFLIVFALVFVHCGEQQATDEGESPSVLLFGQTEEMKQAAHAALMDRLPDDAAPLEYQVFRYMAAEPKSMDQVSRSTWQAGANSTSNGWSCSE